MPPSSTPSAADLIKASFALLEPRAAEVVERFYGNLFAAAPGVRGLFPKDMSQQKRHLTAAIALVVKDSHRLEVLAAPLREMGRRHVAYGAKAEHYPVVRDTLVRTMAEMAGPAWTPAIAQAWTAGLNAVAGYMLEGASQGATAKKAA